MTTVFPSSSMATPVQKVSLNGRQERRQEYRVMAQYAYSTCYSNLLLITRQVLSAIALWNHVGDAIFTSTTDGMVRILSYPSMELQERTGAHCRAIYALGLDPRGT